MTDNTKLAIKFVCEAAVWVAFWGFSITGCVQCHRADLAASAAQKDKP